MRRAELEALDYPCYEGAYELDLTQGCDVGCIYCTLADDRRMEALDIQPLLDGPLPGGGIYVSPNSDCFSELAAPLTHRLLERYLPRGVAVTLITKKTVPDRTIELLARYPDAVIPTVSLSRLDDELNRAIEPGAATAEERLATVRKLHDAGIKVKVRLNPLFPRVDDGDEQLEEIVARFADAGAYCLKTAYVVIRDTRLTQPMVRRIADHPRLGVAWEAMTETIRIHRGKGNVPQYDTRVDLYRRVYRACRRNGLKFGVCSVLDLPVLEGRPAGVPICRNVKTFFGETRGIGVRGAARAAACCPRRGAGSLPQPLANVHQ